MRTRLPASALGHTTFARSLRRVPTEAENRLWYYLRDRRFQGAKFRRQVPIGPYVVDFLCVSASLIVEADGGQHADRAGYDEERTRFLEAKGYRVVRFWNNDVMGNIEGVMQAIAMALTPDPSPGGRGEQKSPFSLGRRVGDEGMGCENPTLTPDPSPASGRGEQCTLTPGPSPKGEGRIATLTPDPSPKGEGSRS